MIDFQSKKRAKKAEQLRDKAYRFLWIARSHSDPVVRKESRELAKKYASLSRLARAEND